MPTYQYACTECGHAFDQVQSFSEDSLTVCPVCSGRLRKVYNAVGVVFKGSGFYRNDSRGPEKSGASSSSSTSASSETTSDSKSETKSESRSETKSETKSESKPAPTSDSKPAASSSGSSGSSSGSSSG